MLLGCAFGSLIGDAVDVDAGWGYGDNVRGRRCEMWGRRHGFGVLVVR